MTDENKVRSLLRLSARIGQDPMLIQASNGNTSIKIGDTLWIKASGKWLADAMERGIEGGMLVPVPLDEVRSKTYRGDEAIAEASGASMETAMHAVLPYKVVVHTHSVNAIAWAVRDDGEKKIGDPLAGIPWQWVPYSASGTPLAQAVRNALSRFPAARVFLLANHGIVICGDDCASAEALLDEVERRLATEPRSDGDDQVSRRILSGGILYPCQVIFLEDRDWLGHTRNAERNLSSVQHMMLAALREVVRRIPANAPIRYLTRAEVEALGHPDSHRYRQNAERHELAVSAAS